MAAEQKERTMYDNIFRLCGPIRFLREREIVYCWRLGEGLCIVQDQLDAKCFYMHKPAFDKLPCK